MSALLLLCVFLPCTIAASICAVSNAAKMDLSDNCGTAAGSSLFGDVAAARGEYEALQILIDTSTSVTPTLNVSLSISSVPTGISVDIFWVGYVFCAPTTRYDNSGGGWHADALMPWNSGVTTIAPGASLTALVRFNVSAGALPGVFSGTITAQSDDGAVLLGTLPFNLTVWDLLLAPMGDPEAFTTIYAYSPNLALPNETTFAGLDQLAALRFPATEIYLEEPYPIWYYEHLAASGAPLLVLADVASLSFADEATRAAGAAARGPRSPSRRDVEEGDVGAGAAASLRRHLQGDPCPLSYNASYVQAMLAFLAPTVSALDAAGLLSRAAVYGFDEQPPSCEPQVRLLFGAIKQTWPQVQTISAINWDVMPSDLPLDIWTLQYEYFNASVAAAWTAAGHRQFLYHCIEPHGGAYLNTFIEHQLIEARLLFWLAFEQDTPGWLYYAVNLWAPFSPVSIALTWSAYAVGPVGEQGPVSYAATPQKGPIGSLAPAAGNCLNDSRLLNFDPANWIWCPSDTTIFANGDGYFLYPIALQQQQQAGVAAAAPPHISTLRFEAQRDGVEDWQLFRLARDRSAAKALAAQLVSAPTVWSSNVTSFEAVRRAIAQLALA